jgi:hypothetical protein
VGGLQGAQGVVAALAGININDRQGAAGRDANVGIRPPRPPRSDLFGIGRRVLYAVFGARMLPRVSAVRSGTGATSGLDGVQREDGETLSGVV